MENMLGLFRCGHYNEVAAKVRFHCNLNERTMGQTFAPIFLSVL